MGTGDGLPNIAQHRGPKPHERTAALQCALIRLWETGRTAVENGAAAPGLEAFGMPSWRPTSPGCGVQPHTVRRGGEEATSCGLGGVKGA